MSERGTPATLESLVSKLPATLWAATTSPAPSLSALQTELRCDVAIVGGGFTGLAAAEHISRSGREPVVLEANHLGWGASGRNGGVVSPKFRVGFPAMEARHGRDTALCMYRLGQAAVDSLEETIDILGLAEARLCLQGHITAAHNQHALKNLQNTADWIRTRTGGQSSVMIFAREVAELTGSQVFRGGLLTPRAGSIHPLGYVHGLARSLLSRGVKLYDRSPVQKVLPEANGLRVCTPQGNVIASQVVYASNGYSDLTASTACLHRRLIPFRSAIIATEPLEDHLAADLMPGGQACGDTRRMLRWFRRVDDRLIFGGRGAFGKNDSEAAFAGLRRSMHTIFPALRETRIDFRWSGLVAMTLDYLPHAGKLGEREFFAAGYNGGGVAMSTYLGQQLARIAAGENPDLRLMAGDRLRPIPLHALRSPAVRLVAGWQQFLDLVGR